MLYQQGDVLIESVPSVPMDAEAVLPSAGRYVLAEGEATGHAHAVRDEIDLAENDGVLYCVANDHFTVVHEEHNPISVPPGVYRVRRVKEYDHFLEEAREVID